MVLTNQSSKIYKIQEAESKDTNPEDVQEIIGCAHNDYTRYPNLKVVAIIGPDSGGTFSPPKISEGVTSLTIANVKLNKIPEFPSTLKYLDFQAMELNCRYPDRETTLPEGIEHVRICEGTNIHLLGPFPSSLKCIEVRDFSYRKNKDNLK